MPRVRGRYIMIHLKIVAGSLAMLLMTGTKYIAQGQQPATIPKTESIPIAAYDRPTNGPLHQSRSVVYARNGMACTSDVRATQAAIDVLRSGGSAVDAAIAANAVLGVVEPMSCGIGGDLFAIVWEAKTKKLHGLNASGRSPRELSLAELRARKLEQIPLDGPLSWSVPGCVSGWHDLHSLFGTIGWADLFSPAIHLAEDGFPVAPVIAGYWRGAERLMPSWPDSAATFLVNGKAPQAGDVFHNPRLATTYRTIAKQGAQEFYRGSIADQIIAFSKSNGGFFSKTDFEKHTNEWVDPVSTNYRGYDVWELPPNGQGIAALEMLNILEQFDIRSMGWGSAEYLHLLIEAKKLAFADRARFYADTDFSEVPVRELISKEYGLRQAKRIDLNRSAVNVPPGDPKLVQGDTIYLCVVDKDGNCCSLIQSNYHGFGSQVVPGQLGFALQNRGNLFSLDDDHPNKFEPGKRPFHTIIPAFVTKDGLPHFVFGVMGGDMQPQGHVQVLVNMIDFDMNIQMAGDAARIRHDGSATPTGTPMVEGGGTVLVESGIPIAAVDRLKAMGHQVKSEGGAGMGGYQGILINRKQGILEGATESRKDGVALGIE
jgi:gamma-glutamyltranspeptidase / glutathione hydrolase